MRIIFFTFYYSPDLGAGSFRSTALVRAISKRLSENDEIHIITTHPNRYEEFRINSQDYELDGNVSIHRINIPFHKGSMFAQIRSYSKFAIKAHKLCLSLKPSYIIGTTGRLMTGLLAGITAHRIKCNYFIDLRDIFSETISDIFSRNFKLLGLLFKLVFSFLEKWLFTKAAGVNVVSEGFYSYYNYKGIDTSNWSFFPNGIDKEFIETEVIENFQNQNIKTILYAGNIGEGQGLEKILPLVAKIIGNGYRFVVVGGGSSVDLLQKSIKKENINNIQILPPVGRKKLIDIYHSADILFLHLNDLPAFRRVLPSKIFEYVSLKKPIVAGLSGYSADFLENNVNSAIIFNPGDVDACINAIKRARNLKIDNESVSLFVEKYSRAKIMDRMSEHIISKI